MREGKIIIKNLKTECRVGVREEERRVKQPIFLDVILHADISEAAKTGSLEKTIDYSKLSFGIKHFAERKEFILLETLAFELCSHILANYKCGKAKVKAKKMKALKDADYAAIELVMEK